MSDHSQKELDIRFTYHPPKPGQAEKYETLRKMARTYAEAIEAFCPDSREKAIALTKLEESNMWANASIARREL